MLCLSTESQQRGNKTMLTVEIYNEVGVVSKNVIEMPAIDD